MEVVQKFEVAVLAGIARERRAPEDRPIAVPAGDEGGLELGMGGAEIAGIGKLGIRQLFLQRRVAIAAETLGGRRHLGRALMLGMAFDARSEEHTSELQSLMRISYAVFCLQNKHTVKQTQYRD